MSTVTMAMMPVSERMAKKSSMAASCSALGRHDHYGFPGLSTCYPGYFVSVCGLVDFGILGYRLRS
ncbi:MAG: hypothetical protein OXD42_14375 [Rhodospirillaceae bacterium]|nr:hypothetical protein [Rhodospirillaceae bacterium]MCY4237481.1 hypothetical protein [Rhodospirillaceae bacterium]